jgi:hypothetical protein
MRKTKKTKDIKEIATSNPLVDINVVAESNGYVDFVREMGARVPDFRIVRSTETRLIMRPPALQKLQ